MHNSVKDQRTKAPCRQLDIECGNTANEIAGDCGIDTPADIKEVSSERMAVLLAGGEDGLKSSALAVSKVENVSGKGVGVDGAEIGHD